MGAVSWKLHTRRNREEIWWLVLLRNVSCATKVAHNARKLDARRKSTLQHTEASQHSKHNSCNREPRITSAHGANMSFDKIYVRITNLKRPLEAVSVKETAHETPPRKNLVVLSWKANSCLCVVSPRPLRSRSFFLAVLTTCDRPKRSLSENTKQDLQKHAHCLQKYLRRDENSGNETNLSNINRFHHRASIRNHILNMSSDASQAP